MVHSSPLRAMPLPDSRLRFVIDNLPDTEVRPSGVHGLGLFAERALSPGETLGWLDGQVVDWTTFDQMHAEAPYGEDSGDLFMEWNALSEQVLLIRPFRTKYSFINHARQPNLCLRREPLRVVAEVSVAAGEELTLDYRREPLRASYLKRADYL